MWGSILKWVLSFAVTGLAGSAVGDIWHKKKEIEAKELENESEKTRLSEVQILANAGRAAAKENTGKWVWFFAILVICGTIIAIVFSPIGKKIFSKK